MKLKKLFSVMLCGAMMASFTACENNSDNNPNDPTVPTEISEQLYVGVVAFNKTANEMPISNNLGKVKQFIRTQTNNEDFTAFCYSVSEGNKMFDAGNLPAFDQIFMLNFSDGTDNYSNMLWGQEGRIISPQNVYDTCKSDLSQRYGLNSYALGFGDDAGFKTQMTKIVLGSGVYKNATSQSQLQSTFNEIAKSMISSAKNVVLKTNAGYYSADAPKYFRFSFTSSKNVSDVILAKMTGTPTEGYVLNVTQAGKYAQFDNPVYGSESNGKVELPLRNLKFVYNNEEITFDFQVEVSFDGTKYYKDVEEASTAEAISKKIAVVLVLDCSESMGSAFEPMKEAAISFINTLTGMNSGNESSGNGSTDSGDTGYIEIVNVEETLTISANSVSFNMRGVEGGTFTMGATSEQSSSAASDEKPTHKVTLSSYYMGETEVTQELWQAVMGSNPSYFSGTQNPVEYVSWEDCQDFIRELNRITGKTFRLPTEAEWEYAARGGSKSQSCKYSGSNAIDNVAWYDSNSSSKTHAVKGKAPNELGLYDMSGNVLEWCQDWYGSYSSSAQTNPMGPSSGSGRVLRGGGWLSDAAHCRVSYRPYDTPSSRIINLGFRLVLEP